MSRFLRSAFHRFLATLQTRLAVRDYPFARQTRQSNECAPIAKKGALTYLVIAACVGTSLACLVPGHASASPCGAPRAFVKPDTSSTHLVMMRDGARTVATLWPGRTWKAGATLVLPVPKELTFRELSEVPSAVLKALIVATSPQLVELGEANPCRPEYGPPDRQRAPRNHADVPFAVENLQSPRRPEFDARPTIRASKRRRVGPYQVQFLQATDPKALQRWLDQAYGLTDVGNAVLANANNAEGAFLVAKLDAHAHDPAEALPGLRLYYDKELFEIPPMTLWDDIGARPLIIYLLSPTTRYVVRDRPNFVAPTNAIVWAKALESFAAFYSGIIDNVFDQHRDAVLTEHAADAQRTPCDSMKLPLEHVIALGADALWAGHQYVPPAAPTEADDHHGSALARAVSTGTYELDKFVLTRMLSRGWRGESALRFAPADPIEGGVLPPDESSHVRSGAKEGSSNNFRVRFIVLKPWASPSHCANPIRNRWVRSPYRDERVRWSDLSAPPGPLDPTAARGLVKAGIVHPQRLLLDRRGLPALLPEEPHVPPFVPNITARPPPSELPPQAATDQGSIKDQHPAFGCGCSVPSSSPRENSSPIAMLALAAIVRWRTRRPRRRGPPPSL